MQSGGSAGTTNLRWSQLYPPSQELRIWLLDARADAVNDCGPGPLIIYPTKHRHQKGLDSIVQHAVQIVTISSKRMMNVKYYRIENH
jgi:hypothetical protein